MEIRDYLKDELKRLNRMNDLLEKKVNQENAIDNEPKQIVNKRCKNCKRAEQENKIYKIEYRKVIKIKYVIFSVS